MENIKRYVLENIDWINIIAGFILTIIGSFIIWLIKGIFQYHRVSNELHQNIKGIWYSAEFDHKNNNRNTILKVKVRRKLGKRVIIKSSEPLEKNGKERYDTGWIVYGKLIADTLIGEWHTTIRDTKRYGTVFLKFLDNARAVGYWIGYSGFARPMYGYWIMSKNLEDLQELCNKVLVDFGFKAYDVSFIIENIDKPSLSKREVIVQYNPPKNS